MSDEFPRRADDDALLNLARAILAEGTPNSTSERQALFAREYGARCGFDCSTDIARAGLGAFIDDLIKMGGPRDVASLVISFQRWYGDGVDSADIADFGCNGEPAEWLNVRMAALAVALWDAGSGSQQQDCDAAWMSSQTMPKHKRSR